LATAVPAQEWQLLPTHTNKFDEAEAQDIIALML